MSDHNSNHRHNLNADDNLYTVTSDSEDFTLRVLTLNCWGLWLGAKKRRQRMAGIVRYLRENNCDIVFLQEVWVSSDFEAIRDGTKDMYRFAHLFRSGSVLGSSGIVILCKWLPKVIHFEPYSLNGSPFYPWHGDWFAGKGIAYSRVDFEGLSLHLFSTHTHAYYKEDEPVHDQYSIHRVCQSYQLSRFITFISDTACNRKSDGKDLFIVAGDMNSTSSELPYKILTTMAGLTDCFKSSRYSNPKSNIIHKHRISKKFNNNNSDIDSNSSLANMQADIFGFYKAKFGDNCLLDTLDGYRNKIAQVLFDSDTEDEDVTYCHPRNSFTPGAIEYKVSKGVNNSLTDSSITSTATTKEESSLSSIKSSDMSSHFQRNDSGQSSKLSNSSKRTKKSPMKRIDFILCKLLTRGHCVVDRIATESKDPTIECSLSDHEPVMVELKISDVSHDLMERNHLSSESFKSNKQFRREHVRPLASIVESKVTAADSSQIEETTNQWVPEKVPVQLSYHECNVQVMESTQSILMQYYQYNRRAKTQLFYIVLLMFIITLPTSTYYALANDLIPISTVVFMWFAASFIFAVGLLIGFLSYRLEQGAIEAILNDISCKMVVNRDRKSID